MLLALFLSAAAAAAVPFDLRELIRPRKRV
jgi:hypothetical protein